MLIMDKKSQLLQAFAIGIKPEQRTNIVDWAANHVKLARSSRSEYADLLQTPWLIQPLETILGNDCSDIVLLAPIGCHAKGTKILTSTGNWNNVEDIKIGDRLLGPDGTIRNVHTLHHGNDMLFEIIPIKGAPFIVNGNHILSLVKTNTTYKDKKSGERKYVKNNGDIINISVNNYINKSNSFKKSYLLYKSSAISFENETEVDHPYEVGMFLGDGHFGKNRTCFFTNDFELSNVLIDWTILNNEKYRLYITNRSYTTSPDLSSFSIKKGTINKGDTQNTWKFFNELGLTNTRSIDKFIPHKYKTASINNRLEILAGILDTDGSLHLNGFDFISKSKQLANDVVFIARSLGLCAHIIEKYNKCQTGSIGLYYRVYISGNTCIIPTKIHRKQASKRLQKKDVLRTGFKVNQIGTGEYFGFEVDKDNLYIMEDFFVTHNSGKTVMLEIAVTYIVAEKPGPCLVGMMSNPDAQELMETGIMPALKNCSLIDSLWPTKRNLIRKDFIQFSHMPIWIGGSNISNFQSKSCDYVFIDEVWTLKKSLLEEAKRRTHDRFGSKFVLMSQAGTIDDDFDKAYNQTYKHEYNYKCPSCNEYHPYNFDNLKWDCDKDEMDNHIWDTLDVRYECPCGHIFKDNVNDRRSMASSGMYLPIHSDNPLTGHIGFHYNALCVWWVDWYKLVIQFLQAIEYKKKGDFSHFKQFWQKRLAKPWDEMELLPSMSETKLGSYTLEEAQAHPYEVKLLTVDVQQDRLYYVYRQWTKQGRSRISAYGMVVTLEDIEKVRIKYDIKPQCVFIDTAYNTEEVCAALAQYFWFGLNGLRPNLKYPYTTKSGKKVNRLYSIPDKRVIKTSSGNKTVYLTNYNSVGFKDILQMQRNTTAWEIASNVGADYLHQLNSEVRILENGQPTYKQIKVDNHFYDCEVMQTVAATIYNCIFIDTADE